MAILNKNYLGSLPPAEWPNPIPTIQKTIGAADQQLPPVAMAISEIHTGMSQLQSIVGMLEERLKPVLRDHRLTETDMATSQKVTSPACALVESLSSIGQELDDLIRRVDGIRDRLCI